MRRIAAVGCALLASFVFTELAEAQRLQTGNGADLHLFRPAIDTRGHIAVNGTDVVPHNKFSFGLVLDAGFGILPYRGFQEEDMRDAAEADREDTIVDQGFTGRLMFNYGLFDRAVIGIQVPFTLMRGPGMQGLLNDGSAFYNPEAAGGTEAPGLSAQGIGDLVIHGKVRILHADSSPIGLAAILRAEIPTGSSPEFLGEPGFSLWPSIVAEVRPHERVRISGELGYRAVFGTGSLLNIDARTIPGGGNATDPVLDEDGSELRYNDLLTFGIGASFRVADTLDVVLESYGTQIASEFGTHGAFSAEALLGLKVFVQEHSFLVFGGGIGYPADGFQAANWRATVGFHFEPAIGDRDGDGIPDDRDGCPDDPEDRDGFEDEDGCPELDNDEDGIPDTEDECPNHSEDFDGIEDEDGCPEGGQSDRDNDGILDEVDECPDEREDRDGFQDEDGCPDPDNDQDGILDENDLCPNDPEDMDGFEDEDGCPEPDNDHDRILDPDDACPQEPETYNGRDDQDGCPDEGSVIIEDNQLIILEKIYFATDSAQILRRSYPIIDAVAATLEGNPQITLIEVQGHADERGGDDYNLRLTRDRAASVVEALAQRGVARNRLRSAGYGELCPVNPAHNQTAWEENRRVEFKIITTVDGPTGVEVACQAGRHLIPE